MMLRYDQSRQKNLPEQQLRINHRITNNKYKINKA
jgi:hypothetical protein